MKKFAILTLFLTLTLQGLSRTLYVEKDSNQVQAEKYSITDTILTVSAVGDSMKESTIHCFTSEELRVIVKGLTELAFTRKQLAAKDSRIERRDIKIDFLVKENDSLNTQVADLSNKLNEKQKQLDTLNKDKWLYGAGGVIGGLLIYGLFIQ